MIGERLFCLNEELLLNCLERERFVFYSVCFFSVQFFLSQRQTCKFKRVLKLE